MRVFVAATEADLRALADDDVDLPGERSWPDSEDEHDEFEAMATAAAAGPVVVAAEVADRGAPVRLEQVQAWHVDADGSGDLAWYATQELPDVLRLLAD